MLVIWGHQPLQGLPLMTFANPLELQHQALSIPVHALLSPESREFPLPLPATCLGLPRRIAKQQRLGLALENTAMVGGGGWLGDGSVAKAFAVQTSRPEFRSPESRQRQKERSGPTKLSSDLHMCVTAHRFPAPNNRINQSVDRFFFFLKLGFSNGNL